MIKIMPDKIILLTISNIEKILNKCHRQRKNDSVSIG